MAVSARRAAILPVVEISPWCKSPLPVAEVVELFPKAPVPPEQLELQTIARDLKRRYAGAMREVVLELTRDQVEAIANAVQAHKRQKRFYHRMGAAIEVMESIVVQWCSSAAVVSKRKGAVKAAGK